MSRRNAVPKRMVTVMVLAPGGEPVRTERIDADDPDELCRLVDGNLGTCTLPRHWRTHYSLYAFCDDEAMIRPEPQPSPNRWAHHLGHAVLRGPIVVVKIDAEGETRSLSPADVANLELLLAQNPSKEALETARFEHDFWELHPSGMAIMNMETGQWE